MNEQKQPAKGPIDELFKSIGELFMENKFLRIEMANMKAEIEALKQPKTNGV